MGHARLVHQCAAAAHEARGVGQRQRAGSVVGGELAERVAGGGAHVRLEHVAGHGPGGGAVREERRLRVVREREILGRPAEHEPAERLAERGVDLVERATRGRKGVGEVPGHAGLLRALAGKEQNDVGRRRHDQKRITMEAHVKPAPKATMSTVEPSCTRPDSIASSRAIGMDADDVLP